MFTTLIKIYPIEGQQQSVIEVLDSMRGPVMAKPGCLDCTVMAEMAGDGAISYMEQWSSREALERNLRSAFFARALEALEYSARPPVVEFHETRSIGGLELIEQARKKRI